MRSGVLSKIGRVFGRTASTAEPTIQFYQYQPDVLGKPGFDGLVGLPDLKKLARVQIASAKQRGMAFPHTLLYGISGSGRTAFARTIAGQMGWGFVQAQANALKDRNDLAGLLAEYASQPTVLFIDEIHAMSRQQQDDVLGPMFEGAIRSKDRKMSLPCMTLIGATTRIDLVDGSVLERFPNRWEFTPYSAEDMFFLVRDTFRLAGMAPAWQASQYLAARCLGLPRRAIELTNDTRDVVLFNKRAEVYEPDAVEACRLKGIDSLGLGEIHRKYLMELLAAGEGGCGLRTLATRIGQNVRVVAEHVEPDLARLGLVVVTGRRVLTEKGHAHLAAEVLL